MSRVTLVALCLFVLVHASAQEIDYNQYVNPLIGTSRMGHTYPGATVPFGMVQLSPETDTLQYELNGKYNKDVYKYCAGYQYDDPTIVGFSHTHFSGTGHSDLGDILVMPTTGTLKLNPGTAKNPGSGYRSKFSHSQEVAQPNHYKVKLESYGINAELTTTTRVGFHQYTFPASDNSHIIIDLMAGIYNYDNKTTWTFVRVENDTLITGYRQTNGWARTRTVYFAITLSKPIQQYGFSDFSDAQVYKGFWRKFDQSKNFPEAAGKKIKMHIDFKTMENEKVMMKVALSPVSITNAVKNLQIEIPHWNFNKTRAQGQKLWNDELKKISIEALSRDEMVNFYTAYYHAMLSPTVYMDADGSYRGIDQNNHQANGFVNYTTFSLWDTYRALHPLFNLIQPKRNADMVKSMLAHYNQSVHRMLPVWSHYANENWCMIGYHSVSVVADAAINGTLKTDLDKALDACVATANQKYFDGLEYYLYLGYVPDDKNSSSVSKTLEYAYDDWAISQLAKKLNRMDVYETFKKRSENWKNVYDKRIGFMRPRMSDGSFKPKFDVLSTHGQGFIEGNAWNYSLYVPHDPTQMIQLMGGKKKFTQHLDSLFTMNLPDEFFADTEDITRDGIIGNYVHGNEPAHHVAYLYNWTDQPWKTQERIRMILKHQYKPKQDGLGGNDDCGQMSAWYIFSSLGFYPVAPASGQYAIGSPSVKKATLQFENGNQLTIECKNQSDKNVFIQKILLNGTPLKKLFISNEEIMKGGKLQFEMGPSPAKKEFQLIN